MNLSSADLHPYELAAGFDWVKREMRQTKPRYLDLSADKIHSSKCKAAQHCSSPLQKGAEALSANVGIAFERQTAAAPRAIASPGACFEPLLPDQGSTRFDVVSCERWPSPRQG